MDQLDAVFTELIALVRAGAVPVDALLRGSDARALMHVIPVGTFTPGGAQFDPVRRRKFLLVGDGGGGVVVHPRRRRGGGDELRDATRRHLEKQALRALALAASGDEPGWKCCSC